MASARPAANRSRKNAVTGSTPTPSGLSIRYGSYRSPITGRDHPTRRRHRQPRQIPITRIDVVDADVAHLRTRRRSAGWRRRTAVHLGEQLQPTAAAGAASASDVRVCGAGWLALDRSSPALGERVSHLSVAGGSSLVWLIVRRLMSSATSRKLSTFFLTDLT